MTGCTDRTAYPKPWLSCHIPNRAKKFTAVVQMVTFIPPVPDTCHHVQLYTKARHITALRGPNQQSSPSTSTGTASTSTGRTSTSQPAAAAVRSAPGRLEPQRCHSPARGRGCRQSRGVGGGSPAITGTPSPALLGLLPYLCLQFARATELHSSLIPIPFNMPHIKN